MSTEQVYLLEDEGQFCLVAKTPYFIPPKDPLHLLSLNPKGQEVLRFIMRRTCKIRLKRHFTKHTNPRIPPLSPMSGEKEPFLTLMNPWSGSRALLKISLFSKKE
jgi:hypothetical protein